MAYGLAMLNHVTYNVVDFARSMIEWMSDKVMRTFEDQRSNPFHFRHMQLCHSLEQLDAVSEPKVGILLIYILTIVMFVVILHRMHSCLISGRSCIIF